MDIEYKFIGRKEILDDMLDCWSRTRIYGIYGTRSIGKSRLAHQFLVELQRSDLISPNPVWVSLKDCRQMKDAFWPILASLDIVDQGYNPPLLATKVASAVGDNRLPYAIVFDNAEDILDMGMEETFINICSIMLRNKCIKIIVTSTTAIDFDEPDMCYSRTVPFLSEAESIELMKSVAPSVEFGPYVSDIAKSCEGLPLVLLIVASELENDVSGLITPADMVQLLLKFRLRVLSDPMYPSEERIAPVYLKFIRRMSQKLQQDLSVLNYIPGSFNIAQATAILGEDSAELVTTETLMPIARRHMLEVKDSLQRYDIHGMLRDCLTEYIIIKNLPEIRRRFCSIFSELLVAMRDKFDTDQFQDAIMCFNLERQNFQKLFTDVMHATEDTYPMFIQVATSATENVLHYFMGSEGLRFFDQCLKMTQDFRRNLDEAYIHKAYGSALTNVIGNLQDGERHYRQSLGILLESRLRDYHLAELYQRFGWNLGCQGKSVEALQYLDKAMEIETELGMYNEKLILQTIASKAIFTTHLWDFKEAEKLHFENLKRRREVFGTDNHPYIGSVMNNIGLMYERMGRMEEAFEYFKRGLEIKIATKANEKAIIISQKNVAHCLSHIGRYDEALEEMDKAMKMLEKFPGLYEEVRAIVLDGKGRIYMKRKDYHRAIPLLKEAIGIRKPLSPENINTVENTYLVAKAFLRLAKFRDAKEWLDRVFNMQERLSKTHSREFCVFDCYKLAIEICSNGTDMTLLDQAYKQGTAELGRLYQEFEKHGILERCEYVSKERTALDLMYSAAKSKIQSNME